MFPGTQKVKDMKNDNKKEDVNFDNINKWTAVAAVVIFTIIGGMVVKNYLDNKAFNEKRKEATEKAEKISKAKADSVRTYNYKVK